MSNPFTLINDAQSRAVLADTIVTAVFMGLVRERLVSRHQVFIGYGGGFDNYAGSQRNQGKGIGDEDVALHARLNTLLGGIFPAYANQLVIGASNKWIDGSKGGRVNVSTSHYVITGAESDKQVHKEMSGLAKSLALDCLNSNRYKEHDAAERQEYKVNQERGAYYGIADLNSREVFGPISTTRQIFTEASGRWMNPSHGWIMAGQARASGSNARMSDTVDERRISQGLPEGPYVLGYTHGMIFAEHICKIAGGGTAYEVSMNEQTCKNASCFGCSTFMFANGMPPSWMHIGSAESWAPLPETLGNFAYAAHFDNNRLLAMARSMNTTWAGGVSRWMKSGSTYTRKSRYSSLVGTTIANQSDRENAYLFLDALTIHGRSDIERIINVLDD